MVVSRGSTCVTRTFMVDLQHLTHDIYHYIVLFQMYIVVFCEGMLAATAIFFGKQAEIVMENPLLKSTSPSEFWGSRWNKLIQGVLKVRVVTFRISRSYRHVL